MSFNLCLFRIFVTTDSKYFLQESGKIAFMKMNRLQQTLTEIKNLKCLELNKKPLE